MNTKPLILAASLAVLATSSQASIFSIDDFTFTFVSEASVIDPGAYYQVRWGTFSGGVFNTLLGASISNDDTGFISVGDSQISASINLGNNNLIAVGDLFYLAITVIDYEAPYATSANEVILTDPSWIAPTFSLVGPTTTVSFSPNTTALKGTYSYNGGNDLIVVGSTPIPEPSAFGAIAGLAAVGFIASRRRRSV